MTILTTLQKQKKSWRKKANELFEYGEMIYIPQNSVLYTHSNTYATKIVRTEKSFIGILLEMFYYESKVLIFDGVYYVNNSHIYKLKKEIK